MYISGLKIFQKLFSERRLSAIERLWRRTLRDRWLYLRRFGFETSSTSVDGLWQGPNAITQNFDTVAWRIQLLGFNTIRLPFSFQVTSPRASASTLHVKSTAVLEHALCNPKRNTLCVRNKLWVFEALFAFDAAAIIMIIGLWLCTQNGHVRL